MKIVFYSTNTNTFDEKTFLISLLPSNDKVFCDFIEEHPQNQFICISQKPAIFMPESKSLILDQGKDSTEVAEKIIEYKPDIAIALSFWTDPYDWLSISDALVAEKLSEKGITTICNPLESSLISFDKNRTRSFFLENNISHPKSIFVDHDLYFCAGSNKEVLRNVYRQSLVSQIKKLKLPLIIKDTTGLSSYGMTVVHTYPEAIGYLNSKRNNSNRLVEEYIEGRQFGLEIYGMPGAYQILPPFEFSINQYGITSPKQSIKYGPVSGLLDQNFEKDLIRLAEKMKLCGSAQIDLVLDKNGSWHIIEVNPRLSGMSYTYAAATGLSIYEMLYRACIEKKALPELQNNVMSLKLPILTQEKMQEIKKIEGIVLLNQTNDLAAKQEREKGFCECIISCQNKKLLQESLSKLKESFPQDPILLAAQKILKL
ncbi:MAG: ATP-grasp domain-containing protein [Treponema sp.]|nr:ATP-grasp domain-containing protein [Treponema sp.]